MAEAGMAGGLTPRISRRVREDLGESVNVTERGRMVVLLETVGAVSVSSEEAMEGGLEGFEERESARERVTRPFGPHAGYD